MSDNNVTVLSAWRDVDLSGWRGPVLLFGGSDSGKSTFARYLYRRLLAHHPRVGFLDADVGQNSFGLPTTMTLAMNATREGGHFPPDGARRTWFVGSNTPSGHVARVLAGLDRLRRFGMRASADALVVDTTGLIDPSIGGADLKWAKVEMLRPCTVVAFQRAGELEPVLAPLRHLHGVYLVELPVSDAVQVRPTEARRAYRSVCYRTYFQMAARVSLSYRKVAVFPEPDFVPGRLAALEDREGFVLALALVEEAADGKVWLHTPRPGKGNVAALRLGDLCIDRDTFQDVHC